MFQADVYTVDWVRFAVDSTALMLYNFQIADEIMDMMHNAQVNYMPSQFRHLFR